jgi:tetratricopeptide (TPR) repeat protein
MQTAWKAVTAQHYDEAENYYREALKIAETLRPPDARLPSILGYLGNMVASRRDFTAAGGFFQRQLKAAEDISGPQNPMAITQPLTMLAMNALAQNDFASAKKFVQRALDANKKFYGDNSAGYAQVLPAMANVYIAQGDYEHAEPYFLQAADIEEKLYNYDPSYGGMQLQMLFTVCAFYDKWGKPEKLEPCDHRLIPLLEKMSGPDTHFLEAALARESKTLRTLGRAEEAEKVEQHLKSLQPATASNPN